MKINLFQPRFGVSEAEAVQEVLSSGNLTGGKEVEKFEKKLANYTGAKYVVAVNSCTSAIYLSLVYQKEHDDIINAVVPSVTFVSVANAVRHAGVRLRLSDKIHVGKSYLIEDTSVFDSAHELYWGCFKKYPPDALVCFSFYPTKPLGGAEGGAIVTNNEKAASWLRLARSHGMSRQGNDWNYNVLFPGWKMNMTDVQAAILNVRLPELGRVNKRRVACALLYDHEFGETPTVLSMHIYSILVKNRDELMKKLKTRGIATSVHFKPIHWQEAYVKDGYGLSTSEHWGKHEVSLPLHENLKKSDIIKIVNLVKKYGDLIL